MKRLVKMRFGAGLSILCLMLMSGCREHLVLHYSNRFESHFIFFDALPQWNREWNSTIVEKLEAGSLIGYNQENVPMSPDSFKQARELTSYPLFEEGVPETRLAEPDELVGEWEPERADFINLMFYNSDVGAYQFYAAVSIDDLEDLLDRELSFSEGYSELYFEV